MNIQILRWESNDITRRADGYFNATFMCQAGGKRWAKFMENAGTAELLEALEASTQIRTSELVQSIRGGTPHQQGTSVTVAAAMGPTSALANPQPPSGPSCSPWVALVPCSLWVDWEARCRNRLARSLASRRTCSGSAARTR